MKQVEVVLIKDHQLILISSIETIRSIIVSFVIRMRYLIEALIYGK